MQSDCYAHFALWRPRTAWPLRRTHALRFSVWIDGGVSGLDLRTRGERGYCSLIEHRCIYPVTIRSNYARRGREGLA